MCVSEIPIFFKKQFFDSGNEEHEDIQKIRENITEKQDYNHENIFSLCEGLILIMVLYI